MANVVLNEEHLTNIANAIRDKNGLSTQYLPSEMAYAIRDIQAGGGKQIKSGTTANPVIYTGLSAIDFIIIYAKKIQAIGLVNTVYNGGPSSISTICAEYSVYTKICGNIESKDFEINGGIFTWNGSEFYGDQFMSGVTYNWIAVGE